MSRVLVFSREAGARFQAGFEIPEDWDDNFDFGPDANGLASIKVQDATYVFLIDESTVAPSIVIQIEQGKLFSCFTDPPSRLDALKRTIDAGMIVLEGGGALPSYWRPHTSDRFMTFQALSIGKGDARRLALWRRLPPAEDPCVFLFDVTTKQRDFISLSPNMQLLSSALMNRSVALGRLPAERTRLALEPAAVRLGDLDPTEQVDTVIHGWKLGYLYESRLTKSQREFVDSPLDRPAMLGRTRSRQW
jgi:hypothetical protein